MYVCMYVCVCVCVCLFVCLYVRVHERIYYLSIYLPIHPSVRLSVPVPTHLSPYLPPTHLFLYLSVCLPMHHRTPTTSHWCHNSSTEQSVPLCDLQGISSSNGERSNRNSSIHSKVVYRCPLRQTAVLYSDNGGSSKTSVPLCQIKRCHILQRNMDGRFATVNSTA